MKKKFKIFCFLLLFLVLMSFYGYTANEKALGGILRIGIGADVTSFDMSSYRSGVDLMLGALVFDRLVAFDKGMQNYIPQLATSWKKKDDLTWIFNLRKDVKFTDGTSFNAEAVKISLERTSEAIRGKRFHGMISTVNILDDYKVEIKLKKPSAAFFSNLTLPTGSIFSPRAIEKYGDEFFKNPVGTGLFKLEEWVPSQRIVFTRNEDYWGPPARLEKVIFVPIPNEASRVMAFKSGDLDVIENLPGYEVPSIEEDPNFKLIITPQLRTVWVGFNTGDAILKDPRVRRAIAHAIDREAIIKYIMENLVNEAKFGLLPPEIMKTDPPLSLNYDPELSKKLLTEAGYEDGLKLQLWTPEGRYIKDLEIAQVVQGQLKKVGIDLSITVMEWSSYLAALNRLEQQMFILGWAVTKSPDAFFRACFHSEDTSNWANYRSKELDKMIDEAVELSDEEEINQAYYEINKVIIENAVVFPIYYTTMIYGLRSNVREFSAHPMELLDLSKTWIE